MRLIVRTDGAARGNPGPAGAGAVLIDADRPDARDPDASPLATVSEALGVTTNNVAEYVALILALERAEALGADDVELLLDSQLIVEQLHGRYRVKNQRLVPLYAEVRARLERFGRWTASHVPRAENRAADVLANAALDRAGGAGGRGGPARGRLPPTLFDREGGG